MDFPGRRLESEMEKKNQTPPKKQLPNPSHARGEAEWLQGPRASKSRQNPPSAACGGGKGGSAPGQGPRGVAILLPTLGAVMVAPPESVPRGHRAYLSSAPHYDFPRYRQLVHEITLAFSGISREVLCIAGRLRDELARPDLAQHLARLQEREQEKLQLVSAGLGGVPPLPEAGLGLLWGGSQLPLCPHGRQRSSSWPGSRHRTSPTWTPLSRRCGSSSTSRWWPHCCLPPIWGGWHSHPGL